MATLSFAQAQATGAETQAALSCGDDIKAINICYVLWHVFYMPSPRVVWWKGIISNSIAPAATEEEEMPKYAASKNMMKGAVRMSIILKKFIKFTAALRGHTRYILVQGKWM